MPNPAAPTVIQIEQVSKAYRIFHSRSDSLIDALGLGRLQTRRAARYQDFWALRDITLTLRQGQRIGVLGRNGAGKTTLLKLITGAIRPTVGTIHVSGKIQALIDLGAGFHPDFTGRENVHASLTYQGFSQREIVAATGDIEDFTELGEFMDRPFRTYSSGMMARLIFATATAVRPTILVIDEILGAGDAYFIGKSSERIRSLVNSGASLLLVSHSMEQITLLCDEAIWLDRGRIVKSGQSINVVTAYGQFIHELEDRRQKARNLKIGTGRHLAREQIDHYADAVVLRFVVPGHSRLEASAVRLFRRGELEAEVRVGDAQDSDASQMAYVDLSAGNWSAPRQIRDQPNRQIQGGNGSEAYGAVGLNLYALHSETQYFAEVTYLVEGSPATMEVWHAGINRMQFELPATGSKSETTRFELSALASPPSTSSPAASVEIAEPVPDSNGFKDRPQDNSIEAPEQAADRGQTRWPGEGSLLIHSVQILDASGADRAVFRVGDVLRLRLVLVAARTGSYVVKPAAVLYRLDGVKVFSHIGDEVRLNLKTDERSSMELDLGPLNLGDGHYAFAVAIYKSLHPIGQSIWYDLIDRDYRFEVIGARAFAGLFEHRGEWKTAND